MMCREREIAEHFDLTADFLYPLFIDSNPGTLKCKKKVSRT